MALYFEFDRIAYIKAITDNAARILEIVTEKIEGYMKQNIASSGDFSAAKLKDPVASTITHRIEERTEEMVSAVVGMCDAQGEYELIRARILEHGTGSKGEEGTGPIKHIKGNPNALNSDVTGRNMSEKESFELPEKFNMPPGHWFTDAMKLVDALFDDAMQYINEGIDPTKFMKLKGDVTISL